MIKPPIDVLPLVKMKSRRYLLYGGAKRWINLMKAYDIVTLLTRDTLVITNSLLIMNIMRIILN